MIRQRPPRPNKPRNLVIGAARPRDAAMLATLVAELNAHQGDPTDHFTAAAARRDLLGRKAWGRVLMARLDGTAVGYAILVPAYESGWAARGFYVSDLHVTEAARQRGVGRALLAAVAAAARRHGASYIWWCSKAWNVEAQAFYRKIGAIEEPVMAHALTRGRFERLVTEGESAAARPIKRKTDQRP
jgi:ribosomal protein S18 acetylase RimI-like enzyme